MNKIILERIVYCKADYISRNIENSSWYNVLSHEKVIMQNLINEGYEIVDVKVSCSASEASYSKNFADHVILILQKPEKQ